MAAVSRARSRGTRRRGRSARPRRHVGVRRRPGRELGRRRAVAHEPGRDHAAGCGRRRPTCPRPPEPATTEPPATRRRRPPRHHAAADRAAGTVAPGDQRTANCSPTSRSATSSTSTPTSRCATYDAFVAVAVADIERWWGETFPEVYGEQFEPLERRRVGRLPRTPDRPPGLRRGSHELRGSQPVRRLLLRSSTTS